MTPIRFPHRLAICILLALTSPLAAIAQFSEGTLLLSVIGDGITPLDNSAHRISLVEVFTNGAATGRLIAFPEDEADGLSDSGSAKSSGHLQTALDGNGFLLSAFRAAKGTQKITTSSSANTPRRVIRVQRDLTITSVFEETTHFSNEGIRAVSQPSQDSIFVSAPSGLFKANTSTSPVTLQKIPSLAEPRLVAFFRDASETPHLLASTATDIHRVNSDSSTKAQPLGLDLEDAHAFVLLDRSPTTGADNLGGLDTLYVADGSSESDFGQAVLKKFEWRGGRWTAAGVATLPVDGSKLFGLTATRTSSGAVTLHATTSLLSNNALVTVTDHSNNNQFGGNLSGTLTVLARAGENRAFRGLAALPQSNQFPDLAVTLPDRQPATVKVPFPLQINIQNLGASASTPCLLHIKLPPTLSKVDEASPERVFETDSDTISTEIEPIAPRSSARITLLVEALAEGEIVIPAGSIEIDPTQRVVESKETNNQNNELKFTAGIPRLSLIAKQARIFQRGDNDAQLVVTLKNEGKAPALGPLEITPSFPPGTRIVSLSGNGWSPLISDDGTSVRAIRTSDLPPETETSTLFINLEIDSSAENGDAVLSASFNGTPPSENPPTLSVPLKIQDSKTGVVSFETNRFSFQESAGNASLTLVRQGGRRGTLTASVSVIPETATADRDFRVPTTSVTFADGSDTALLPLEILTNAASKTHRAFTIKLGPNNLTGQFASARVMILKPDSAPPVIKVSTPASGAVVSGSKVDVVGKVSDNFSEITLKWSVNGGPLSNATSLSADGSFRIPISAQIGVNVVTLSATDAAGNQSTVQHAFLQSGTTRLSVESTPPEGGTIALSPKVDLAKVQVGSLVTLQATPATNYVWSGWEISSRPGELLRTPRLVVQASSGLSVRARFSPSPYTDATGTYSGLVRPPPTTLPRHETSGISTLSLTSTGTYSGKIRVGNEETSLSGWLDETGTGRFGDAAQPTFPWYRKDGRTLHIQISLDPLNPSQLVGSINDPSNLANVPLSTFSLVRSAILLANPNPGIYNVAAPSKKQDNGIPRAFFHEGAALGTIVVPAKGSISFAVRLADGNNASGSAPLREDGSFVLHSPLYSDSGQFSGEASINASTSVPSVSGKELLWLMPAGVNAAFPLGWPEGIRMDLEGSLYPATPPTLSRLLPNLNKTSPQARISITSQSSNTQLRADINISPDGKITSANPSQPFAATLNLKTGFVQGTFPTGPSTTLPFSLALLPKKSGSDAYGQLLFSNGTSANLTLSQLGGDQGKIIISEVAAKNVNGPFDEDGDASDWIELHNPNPFKVDLDGWFLSDDPNDPEKWTFPKAEIDSQGFLLVWASGKNRRQSTSKLHTNFSLESEGEFLSLTRADGATEQSFPQGIPKLGPGESYGVDFGSRRFIEYGATINYFTGPGALPQNWATPDFKDTSWKQGKQPLGYGVGTKGLSIRQVLTNYDKGGVPTLAQAEALLNLPRGHADIVAETTFTAPQLNLLGDGSDGHYGENLTVPLTGEPYVIRATGTILIPEAGTYTFGLNSDDGGTIRIDGNAVMVDDSNHGPEDHLSGGVTLSAGPHAIEVIMWEQGGGDEVELFAARGTHPSWNETFRLIGADDGLAVVTLGAGNDSPSLGTNLETSIKGLRTDLGARYTFTCDNPTSIERLTLNLAANDGVVIFLNGTEVLRDNAGLSGFSVSRATSAKDPLKALTPKSWDLSTFKHLLRKGQNVLAARCLSSELNDSSLYLAIALSGHSNVGTTYGIFSPSDSGLTSTPNAINSGTFTTGTLGEVRSSHGRGIYNAPFQLTLLAPSTGASLRYTVDGSLPSLTNGETYTKPITISKTTILRFAAVQTGMKSGPVSTTTFLFPNDIIRQSADGKPPGPRWPQDRVNGQDINYGMDPRVVNSTDPEVGGAESVKAALEAIPTLSIVTELENLFDPSRGIWVHPYNRGLAWERPASVEFINDSNHPSRGFQTDCGIRIRGGFSRSTDNPKHALKLYFRDDYAGPLKYPLFGAIGADTFEQIDIRTAQNYSWSFGGDSNNTFLREEMSRELQGAMGHPHSRGRDFHLFLNGQYWGLYNFDERTEASFAASYLGGKKSEYDAIKCEQDAGYTTGVTDGNLDAWTNFFNLTKAFRDNPSNDAYFAMQGLGPDGVTPTDSPVYLDVDNLIDYMLLTFWSGNLDGCTSAFLGETAANNWSAVRRRGGTRGFVYFAHDFEHSFFDINQDRTGPFETDNKDNLSYSNPMFIHHNLRGNAEYRMRWADRIQQHCFGNGALTATALHQRFSTRADLIDRVIVAESARWGDAKTGEPLTRREWRAARDQLLNWYIPNRGEVVIRQLKEDGLFPNLSAPTSNIEAGMVAPGSSVRISTNRGVVYYTWNGSDPREIGGAVHPNATPLSATAASAQLLGQESTWRFFPVSTDIGSTWTEPVFDDSEWMTGHGEMGYGDGDEDTIVPTISNPTPELSRNVTTYFRTTFSVSESQLPTSLTAKIKFDDGVALYLNGNEVFRSNNLPKNADPFTLTDSPVPDESAITTIAIPTDLLKVGLNVLCAEIHQSSPESSDISFRCELNAESSSEALIPVPVGKNVLKLRALHNGEWSAITALEFNTGDSPALQVQATSTSLEAGKLGQIALTIQNRGQAPTGSHVRFECEMPADFRLASAAGVGWQVASISPTRLSATLLQSIASESTSAPLTLTGNVASGAALSLQLTPILEFNGTRFEPTNPPSPVIVTRTGTASVALESDVITIKADELVAMVSVVRTGDISKSASVTLSTADGTALKDRDYLPITQLVSFAPGEFKKQVSINLTSPSAGERTESFKVTLSKPNAASLATPSSASVFIVGADTVAPKIQLTTKSTASLTQPSVLLSGTATDDQAIAFIEISVNGTPWQPFAKPQPAASKTAAFNQVFEPPVGTSTVALRVLDLAGNASAPAFLNINRLPSVPVATASSPTEGGSITLTPAGFGNWLLQGSPVEARAIPSKGWFFSHWLLNPTPAESRVNPLVLTPILPTSLTAVFKPSPFDSKRSGTFVGTLQTATGNPANSTSEGVIKVVVTNTGAFSGTVTLGNNLAPFAGTLGLSGEVISDPTQAIRIPRKGDNSLQLRLSMDLNANPVNVTASLEVVERTFLRPLAGSSLKRVLTTATPQAVVLKLKPVEALNSTSFTQPDSPLNVTVTKTASGLLAGKLPDGSAISAAFSICEDQSNPFFVTYGSNKQHLLRSNAPLTNPLPEPNALWIRTADPTYPLPEGWPSGLQMFWERAR